MAQEYDYECKGCGRSFRSDFPLCPECKSTDVKPSTMTKKVRLDDSFDDVGDGLSVSPDDFDPIIIGDEDDDMDFADL